MANDHPSSDPKESGYERSPVVLKGAPSESEVREKREAQNQQKQHQYNDRQLFFNFLLVVVGVLTVGVYAYQAHIMVVALDAAKISADAAKSAADSAKASLDEVRKGGADTHTLAESARSQAESSKAFADAATKQVSKLDSLTKETRDLAGNAQRSAEISERALAAVHENFMEDQRPYILATPRTPHVKGGDKITWSVDYKNSGKSPAIHLQTCFGLIGGKGAVDTALDFTSFDASVQCSPDTASDSVVANDGGTGFTTAISKSAITEAEAALILESDSALVVVGVIRYTDRFNRAHKTTLCSYRLANGAIANCQKHNYID